MASTEMFVFSVFDKKSETHNLPFFMRTLGEAMRAFQDLCGDEKTVMFRHPEDFKLVKLGIFDAAAGTFRHELVTLAHADEFRLGNGRVIGVIPPDQAKPNEPGPF